MKAGTLVHTISGRWKKKELFSAPFLIFAMTYKVKYGPGYIKLIPKTITSFQQQKSISL